VSSNCRIKNFKNFNNSVRSSDPEVDFLLDLLMTFRISVSLSLIFGDLEIIFDDLVVMIDDLKL